MSYKGAVDPAPDRDLPSDIHLRLYLEGLVSAMADHDREPAPGSVMEKWVHEARERASLNESFRKEEPSNDAL